MTAPAQPSGPGGGGMEPWTSGRSTRRQPSEGVRSVQTRADYGTVVTAVLHKTCGHLTKIAEEIRQQ